MKFLQDLNVQRFFMLSGLLLLVTLIAMVLLSGTIIVPDMHSVVRLTGGGFWLVGEAVLLVTLAKTYFKDF